MSKAKAILYDATLCTGCKQCEKAHAQKYDVFYDEEIAAEDYQSAHKVTMIQEVDGKFMRKLCLHCDDPLCSCPMGGYAKLEEGPMVYRGGCVHCGNCVLRCVFNQSFLDYGSSPFSVKKCQMCPDLVTKGLAPACATACPTGATKFGDRDALLAEAKERIRQNPDKYVNHIYGETEAGGCSVMLLSSIPFEKFGWPTKEDLDRKMCSLRK